MPTERRCEKCGAALASFGAEALCPNCMLREAVGLGAGDDAQPPAADPGPGATSVVKPVTEKPGDRIGRYKLLQQIGEGGMGVVYMAEQEEPVRRRVALKVIKLGMDTRSVIARFEAERQALALMDHPNIAKVFDAGATESPTPGAPASLPASFTGPDLAGKDAGAPGDPGRLHGSPLPSDGRGIKGEGSFLPAGRPYFVMELVRGIRITDYCDQNHLSTPQRLQLFTQVCQAIQHAHQKGVIHRDIKPSNILVTLHDGVPVPKIIDFGIAKATSDQRLTDKTLFTAFEQFLGTPAYMSPEQAELSGLDIDTRSDIYSLGVLLYELLTGQTPFASKELLAAGLDAMRRTIREKEPPKPSTRLTQELAAAKSVGRVTPCAPSLGESTSTDGAHGVTRPTSNSKKDEAFARRLHQVKDLIPLVRGDLDWIVMKALEKDRARRYESANGLAMDIQRHLDNEPVVACPPSKLYRFQKLVRRNKIAVAATSAVATALVIGLVASIWLFLREKAARQRAMVAEQKSQTEAKKSEQVARFLKDMLKGVGPGVALGRDTKLLQEILDMTAQRIGKDLTNQPQVEAELRNTLGEVYLTLGDYGKAESLARDCLAMAGKASGNKHRNEASALINLAYVLYREGKLAEAERMGRKGLAMQKKLRVGNREYGGGLNTLALILASQAKFAEAELLSHEALTMSEDGAANRERALFLGNLADLLRRQGKLAEAETKHRESLTMFRKVLGNEHPDVAHALGILAFTLQLEDKLAEAEAMNREGLALNRKFLGNEHPNVATSLHNLALVLHREGKHAEAETMQREGLLIQRKLLGADHPEVAASLQTLAYILRDEGKLAEAQALEREWLQNLRKRLPADDDYLITALAVTTMYWVAEGLFTEVEPLARECLTLREKKMPDDWRTFNSRSILGGSLLGQKKYVEAEPLLLSGCKGMKQREDSGQAKIPASGKHNLPDALRRLVQLYEETGRPEKAAEWKQKLEAFSQPAPATNSVVGTKPK